MKKWTVSLMSCLTLVTILLVAVGCGAPAPSPSPSPAPATTAKPAPAPSPSATPSATTAPAPKPSPSPQTTQSVMKLTLGSTEATSSTYVLQAAMTKAINLVPGIQATLVEAGGSDKATEMLRQGLVDISLSVTPSSAHYSYNSLGAWKDKPAFKDMRPMLVKMLACNFVVVREDSGIKTLEELNGKKVSLGPPGSSDSALARKILSILGIKIDEFVGSFGDAIEAMKDRRIVGIIKGGIGKQLDAGVAEMAASTKLRIIGITKEQAVKIIPADPTMSFTEIPANSVRGVPGHAAFSTYVVFSASGATPKVSQSTMYAIMKALVNNWKSMIVPAYGPSGDTDPAGMDTINAFSQLKPAPPLHAGVVQFYLEKGLQVPDFLIPPEFKK